jgi:hypothetical protein
MALKPVVDSLDQVAEPFRPEYVQKDGKFVLSLDGDPLGYVTGAAHAELNGKFSEFRESNKRLIAALGVDSVDKALARAALVGGIDAAKLERLKAIDPDEYEALKVKAAKLKDKGIDDADGLDVKLKAMLDAALKPVQDALSAEKTLRTDAQQRADKALLRQTVGDKFIKAGGKANALDFVLGEAQKSFSVVDNEVRAGENKFSAQKPSEPLGLDEWLEGAMKDYDFAFNPSAGGGADGGRNGGRPPAHTGQFKMASGEVVKMDGITTI